MDYYIYPNIFARPVYKEKYKKAKIPYITLRKMKKIYPDSDFIIIGEIGNCKKEFEDQDILVANGGKKVPIFPRGSRNKTFEWISGYIAVGENTYAAAIKSIYPSFIGRNKRVKFKEEL